MDEQIKSILQSLTIRQKIGLLLVGQAEGTELTPDFRAFIEQYPISGYRVNGPNIQSCEQVKALTTAIQQIYDEQGLYLPVIFASDQETGTLSVFGKLMTEFPGNMALAAADDLDLTKKQGHVVGSELREMGINHLLAPVADVNIEEKNPVIGVRSFGDHPERVADHCCAYIAGVRQGGVASCAKHFPGHGNTRADTHTGCAVNDVDLATLFETEIVPFQRLIEHQVDSVMVSHVICPQIDTKPASLSAKVISGLLREQLGYQGVVISDDLAMGAIRQDLGAGEAVLQFILAGGDIAYIHDGRESIKEAITRLEQAYKIGELTEERLNQSIMRILTFKQKIMQYSRNKIEDEQIISRQISERSITLVRDPRQCLPLVSNLRLLLVMPLMHNITEADTTHSQENHLETYLREKFQQIKRMEISPDREIDKEEIGSMLKEVDLVLFATYNAHQFSYQVKWLKMLAESLPVIAILLRDPYDISVLPPECGIIATYSMNDGQMKALVERLIGEKPFVGKLPVQIHPNM